MEITIVLLGRSDRKPARFPEPKESTTNCSVRGVNAELLTSSNKLSRQLRVCQGAIDGIPAMDLRKSVDDSGVARLVRSQTCNLDRAIGQHHSNRANG